MTSSPGPADPPPRVRRPGVEQTTEAWERTALALIAVSAATARHTWSVLGVAALAPLIPAVLLTVWTFGEEWRRYDDDEESPVYRPIAGPTFFLAATTALIAGTEAVHLFAG